MSYLSRSAEKSLAGLLRNFPVVLVLGPRQCGKSTLVRHTLPDWTHLDLERPSERAVLETDLEGFFERHPRRVAIDEAQLLPALFSVLRSVVDRGAGKGRFVLTGSANPSLVRGVAESLAGRVGLLELGPFTHAELASTPRVRERWFWGGYPPVLGRRGARARAEWLDSYVATYLERDLPVLGVRLPAPRLRALWTMLTHVHGNLLNVSDLARSLGVSSPTVAGDLAVLESTFMVRRLQPFHANVQKRLTKSPKLYLRDSGLLHFLAGLRSPSELPTWSRRGASFEGLVIEELASRAAVRDVRPEVYFWRTQAGAEVDLLLVAGRRIVPVEIKLGAAVELRALAGLRQCMSDLGLDRGYVITTGAERLAVGRGIDVLPWRLVMSGEIELPER